MLDLVDSPWGLAQYQAHYEPDSYMDKVKAPNVGRRISIIRMRFNLG